MFSLLWILTTDMGEGKREGEKGKERERGRKGRKEEGKKEGWLILR